MYQFHWLSLELANRTKTRLIVQTLIRREFVNIQTIVLLQIIRFPSNPFFNGRKQGCMGVRQEFRSAETIHEFLVDV